MGFLDTSTDTKAELNTSNGDHERLAHYAPKDEVTESYIMGTPIMALCGKVWVPSRDPNKYPICLECKELLESLSYVE
jgi:hypothetical protein